MSSIIEESLQIATKRFEGFGFQPAQIEQLLISARRDMEKEIATLTALLEEEHVDMERINQSLHALKGLLYNVGNTEAGDLMIELKSDTNQEEALEKIRKRLGLS